MSRAASDSEGRRSDRRRGAGRARGRGALLVALALATLALALACTVTNTRQVTDAAGSEQILERADRNFHARQYRTALEGYKVAAAAASTEGDEGNLVRALSQAAHLHVLAGMSEVGRDWLAQAEGRASAKKPLAWATFLLARGVFERHDGLLTAAAATFSEMYHFAMDEELYAQAMQAAHMATLVTTGDARLTWGRRGLDAAEASEEPSWIAHQWGALGWLFEEAGRSEAAVRAFETARALTASWGGATETLKADWALGHGLRVAGRLDEARQQMNLVLRRAEERYMLSRAETDAEWLGHAQQEMGELALADGNRKRAVGWLREAKRHFVEAGIQDLAPEALAELDRRIHELELGSGPKD